MDLENKQKRTLYRISLARLYKYNVSVWQGRNVTFRCTSSVLENWKRPDPDPCIFENHNAPL